jgi:hypothetical protein
MLKAERRAGVLQGMEYRGKFGINRCKFCDEWAELKRCGKRGEVCDKCFKRDNCALEQEIKMCDICEKREVTNTCNGGNLSVCRECYRQTECRSKSDES